MPANARDNAAPDHPSAQDGRRGGLGLTPERRAALEDLERELAAILKATGRQAA